MGTTKEGMYYHSVALAEHFTRVNICVLFFQDAVVCGNKFPSRTLILNVCDVSPFYVVKITINGFFFAAIISKIKQLSQ